MKRFRFRGASALGMMLGVQMVACTGALAISLGGRDVSRGQIAVSRFVKNPCKSVVWGGVSFVCLLFSRDR
jgi:hypothetical protein